MLRSIFSKIVPSYFLDKFDGKDVEQLQLMSHDLYLQVLNGTDNEAKAAVNQFVEQQRRGGVHILEATLELLSDIHYQARTQGKERS